MREDFARLSPEAFLRRYGHLRPGTYDITSARYDEKPELYFHWQEGAEEEAGQEGNFRLSLPQLGRKSTMTPLLAASGFLTRQYPRAGITGGR